MTKDNTITNKTGQTWVLDQVVNRNVIQSDCKIYSDNKVNFVCNNDLQKVTFSNNDVGCNGNKKYHHLDLKLMLLIQMTL